MSETMREALPIIFMFGCALALGPIVGFAMWMAFDGDRLREPEADVQLEVLTREAAPAQLTTEATSAA